MYLFGSEEYEAVRHVPREGRGVFIFNRYFHFINFSELWSVLNASQCSASCSPTLVLTDVIAFKRDVFSASSPCSGTLVARLGCISAPCHADGTEVVLKAFRCRV